MTLTNTIQNDKILSLWKKYTLLPVDPNIDFFESGGDSLAAINMIVEIQNIYKVDFSLESFMRAPTLTFLISKIEHAAMEAG